ncbi:MAG: hypothetical protein LBP31_00640 [Holosporales bacterium]|nr:hypothetical protein [Holosporales bacterium]
MKKIIVVVMLVVSTTSMAVGATLLASHPNYNVICKYKLREGQWWTTEWYNTNTQLWGVLDQANQVTLTRNKLLEHLITLKNDNVNCIREVIRLILAQQSENGHGHNVVANDSANYMTLNNDQIHIVTGALQNHLLYQGHLRFFPKLVVNNENTKVTTTTGRSIFHISNATAQRINNQINVHGNGFPTSYNLHELCHNGLRTANGYDIDPNGITANNTLKTEVSTLLQSLLQARPWEVSITNIYSHGNNEINIISQWNAHNNPIDENKIGIGKNIDGNNTEYFTIGLAIENGVIRITTIFPGTA